MSVTCARQLRKTMTPFEARLWLALRALRNEGLHFGRQSPRDGYVLDFVCLRARLIVEPDGDQHALGDHPLRDRLRDAHFAAQGYETLRFWNQEIRDNFGGVVEGIFRAAMARQVELDQRLVGRPVQP